MDAIVDREIKKCLDHLAAHGSPLTVIIHQDKYGNIFHYTNNISEESLVKICAIIIQASDKKK